MEAYYSTVDIVTYLSKIAPVYTIFGNVESSNKDTREESRKIGLKLPFLYDSLKKMHNVRVINNVVANFEGIRIGGLEYFMDTSWVREFKPSDFADNLKEAKKESEKAQNILRNFGYVDILISHQPPYGVLDKVTSKNAPKTWQGKHAGSKVILDYLKRKQPHYVFCGHIHESEGMKKLGRTEVYNLGVVGYKIIEIGPSQ